MDLCYGGLLLISHVSVQKWERYLSLESAAIKVRSILKHSCAILISFKIVVIFNITSADFVLI